MTNTIRQLEDQSNKDSRSFWKSAVRGFGFSPQASGSTPRRLEQRRPLSWRKMVVSFILLSTFSYYPSVRVGMFICLCVCVCVCVCVLHVLIQWALFTYRLLQIHIITTIFDCTICFAYMISRILDLF